MDKGECACDTSTARSISVTISQYLNLISIGLAQLFARARKSGRVRVFLYSNLVSTAHTNTMATEFHPFCMSVSLLVATRFFPVWAGMELMGCRI